MHRMICLLLFLATSAYGDTNDTPPLSEPCQRKQMERATWLRNRADMVQMAICYFSHDIDICKRKIAEEYALAKYSGGGIIDKEAIYHQQEAIRATIGIINELRDIQRALLKLKEAPLSCKSTPMRKTLNCVITPEDHKPKYCRLEPWATFAMTLDDFTDVMAEIEKDDECPSLPPPFAN